MYKGIGNWESENMYPEFKKYGFGFPVWSGMKYEHLTDFIFRFSDDYVDGCKKAQKYLELVTWCHLSVASYLDDNDDVRKKYGDNGFMYYDILRASGAQKWYDEAFKLITARKDRNA